MHVYLVDNYTFGWARSCMGQDGQDYVEFEVPGEVLVRFKCTKFLGGTMMTFGEFIAFVTDVTKDVTKENVENV